MNYSAYQVVETENGFEGSITQLEKPTNSKPTQDSQYE